MKALLAASQCPHCGHLFELRDSFGELLPLAHCPTCDSDYPRKLGACRWCGTKPEGFRIAPYAWKGVGVLAFVGLAWGAWLADRSNAEDASRALTPADEPTVSLTPPVDSGDAFRTLVHVESADTEPERTPTDVAAVDALPVESAGQVTPTRPPTAADTIPVRAPAMAADTMPVRAPTTVAPRARPSFKASAPPRRRVRWVIAVVRTWIPVRANANHKSRIVASVGPDTRVQLGEARGTWIRLRTRGLSGWVERRFFFPRSESAR